MADKKYEVIFKGEKLGEIIKEKRGFWDYTYFLKWDSKEAKRIKQLLIDMGYTVYANGEVFLDGQKAGNLKEKKATFFIGTKIEFWTLTKSLHRLAKVQFKEVM